MTTITDQIINKKNTLKTNYLLLQAEFKELKDYKLIFYKGRAASWLGMTRPSKQQILINGSSLIYDDLSVLLDTLKHEVAHVLAPNDCRHGKEWKSKCLLTGAIPHSCGKSKIESKLKLTCDCGKYKKSYSVRVKKWLETRYHCRHCDSNLHYEENPKFIDIKKYKKYI